MSLITSAAIDVDKSTEKEIPRIWIVLKAPKYAEVMKGECFHDHRIIEDSNGTYRWESFPDREEEIMDWYGAKDLNDLFSNGGDKNHVLVRELYRCMGYSIFGYWEVFYWDMNNFESDLWLDIVDELLIEQKCEKDSNIL